MYANQSPAYDIVTTRCWGHRYTHAWCAAALYSIAQGEQLLLFLWLAGTDSKGCKCLCCFSPSTLPCPSRPIILKCSTGRADPSVWQAYLPMVHQASFLNSTKILLCVRNSIACPHCYSLCYSVVEMYVTSCPVESSTSNILFFTNPQRLR